MTYVTDPIGDLLTRMRNAQHARKSDCRVPWSRLREQIVELLKAEGWIQSVEIEGTKPFSELVITFFSEKQPLQLKRISKPGRRVYAKAEEIKPVLHGYGISIITTSQGLVTDKQARQLGIGGEILCTIS